MPFTTRPTLRGYGGAVSAGHYLATGIGARVLTEGGNAADAACARGLALLVLEYAPLDVGALGLARKERMTHGFGESEDHQQAARRHQRVVEGRRAVGRRGDAPGADLQERFSQRAHRPTGTCRSDSR